MSVAKIIHSQLYASPLDMMTWGASAFKALLPSHFNNLPHQGGLLFTVSGIKHKGQVMIRLMGNDTYTVSIGNLKKGEWSEKAIHTDIYVDMLHDLIDDLIEGTKNKSSEEVKVIYEKEKVPFFS